MAATLLLNRDTWDLAIDAAGNIAVASEPYSQQQDVASECRVFDGECYYDTTRGVPYFTSILGRQQPSQVLKERLAAAAKLVPGVTQATVFLTSIDKRQVRGQVQFNNGTAVL